MTQPNCSSARRNALFKRKEIWIPTWKGWLLFFAITAVFLITSGRFIAPFLSPNKPIGAPVLVVEGWLSDAGLTRAIALYDQNKYELVITTGQGIEKGMDISHYGTYAELGAARLVNLGFKGTNIMKAPAARVPKDRTYHSARALRQYLLTNTSYRAIDVVSDSVHSRRSWLLFQKACGPEIKVGVIATENPEFDAKRWWRSSNGVRTVLSEAIGYFYARFVFNPE